MSIGTEFCKAFSSFRKCICEGEMGYRGELCLQGEEPAH